MNRNTGMIAGILAAVTLFGCAKEPSYLKAESKEDNTIEAVAVNAANGSESNADITIGENELAVVDVDMTTGQIQVVFEKEGSGKAAVDYTFYTDGTTEYELEPGEYSVTFSIPEKTNGTIKITTKKAPEASAEDGQNPVMNFIGVYEKDRCSIQVEADGNENAKFMIHWGSSAFEHTEWEMSGKLDTETLTVHYDNAIRRDVVFKEDGSADTETVVYENGKGSFKFNDEGSLTLIWNDEQEHQADDMVFEYSSAALTE